MAQAINYDCTYVFCIQYWPLEMKKTKPTSSKEFDLETETVGTSESEQIFSPDEIFWQKVAAQKTIASFWP